MKQDISKIRIVSTLGFLYWLNETHNLRGLKNQNGTIPITEYPMMIMNLQKEYNEKYPDGLTCWSTE